MVSILYGEVNHLQENNMVQLWVTNNGDKFCITRMNLRAPRNRHLALNCSVALLSSYSGASFAKQVILIRYMNNITDQGTKIGVRYRWHMWQRSRIPPSNSGAYYHLGDGKYLAQGTWKCYGKEKGIGDEMMSRDCPAEKLWSLDSLELL
jgi:hypothetical protein